MAEDKSHTFINNDPSNPRPTAQQRQAVSTYVGKYFRNRSAPAQRKHSTRGHAPSNTSGLSEGIPQRSSVDNSRSHPRSLMPVGGAHGRSGTNSGSNNPQSQNYRSILGQLPLLRPVVECFVPAYPTEHRQKVFDVLDFHIHYLAARLRNWGTGPTPFMRCWVQMVCGDMTLFEAVATFTHGVYLTTMENQIEPSAKMLWHKTRALRGLQMKISTETEDKEETWTANETILATFYLMEGAARFGYESEFKSHCLGLLRMMQLRGEVASGCLKDLYVTQAVGLVEGTEMASELKHGVASHSGAPTSREAQAVVTASASSTRAKLRYPRQSQHYEDDLRAQINAAPAGFNELIISGDLGIEFILLLDEVIGSIDRENLQRLSGVTEATERQTNLIKQARLLEKESQNAVERLACLGVIMFLTRRTSQMRMFPEVAFIDKLTALGRQMRSYDQVGTSRYNDLRIWATLVGLETMATAGATLKQRAHEAAREVLYQGGSLDGWDDVERIAKRYLWDEKSLAAWKDYWVSGQDTS